MIKQYEFFQKASCSSRGYSKLLLSALFILVITACKQPSSFAVTAAPANKVASGLTDKAPNFLIIMADDLGYGDLSSYGSEVIQTPHLDAMAEEGIKFTDFHSNGSVCSPTRASLMTGRYPQRVGVPGVVTAKYHRDKGMYLDEVTFADLLQGAGYRTALFGKWHLGYSESRNPVQRGFDEFIGFVSGNVDYQTHVDQEGHADWWHNDELVPENGYSTDLITHHALRYLDARAKEDKPFALYIAHESPHYPYQGPGDPGYRQAGVKDPMPHGRVKDVARAYKEMVQSLDVGVGQVLDKLRQLNLADNTLVIFMSDNGSTKSAGSTGGLRGYKATLWEGGHRVPAIAWWPGTIASGHVTDETALTMDLFPTMAALAGVATDNLAIDGIDLSPLLLHNRALPQRQFFWSFKAQTGELQAMRDGAWKMVNKQLFRLDQDIGEQNDLAATFPERLARMQKAYNVWYQSVTNKRAE